MKKLLLLGATVLLASTLGASAGPYSNPWTLVLYGTNVTTHGDVMAISKQGDDYFAQRHNHFSHGFLQQSFGVGMTASTPDIYQGIIVTDFGKNGTYQACYDIQYPFVDGGRWVAYRTVDGQKVSFLGQGFYNLEPSNVVVK